MAAAAATSAANPNTPRRRAIPARGDGSEGPLNGKGPPLPPSPAAPAPVKLRVGLLAVLLLLGGRAAPKHPRQTTLPVGCNRHAHALQKNTAAFPMAIGVPFPRRSIRESAIGRLLDRIAHERGATLTS